MENLNIDEMIADAKAEEQVEKEQAKATEEKEKEDFKEALKAALMPKSDSKVTIPLSEYVILLQKEADLGRLLDAIVHSLDLGYNDEYLILNKSENVVDAIRVLYPDVYDHLLTKAKLERAENEGE